MARAEESARRGGGEWPAVPHPGCSADHPDTEVSLPLPHSSHHPIVLYHIKRKNLQDTDQCVNACRLPRYSLLLRDLIKATDEDHFDMVDLSLVRALSLSLSARLRSETIQ